MPNQNQIDGPCCATADVERQRDPIMMHVWSMRHPRISRTTSMPIQIVTAEMRASTWATRPAVGAGEAQRWERSWATDDEQQRAEIDTVPSSEFHSFAA